MGNTMSQQSIFHDQNISKFAHSDHNSNVQSSKKRATAQGCIYMRSSTIQSILDQSICDHDGLTLAEIYGTFSARKTYEIIPSCANKSLGSVKLNFDINRENNYIRAICTTTSNDHGGAEMESLAGVNGALLTLYNIAKKIDDTLYIGEMKLLEDESSYDHSDAKLESHKLPWSGLNVCTLTITDSADKKHDIDEEGLLTTNLAKSFGAKICRSHIVSDQFEDIELALEDFMSFQKPNIIITTGGTGLSPNDKTPEVLMKLADKDIPGIGELLRQEGSNFTSFSYYNRSLAVISRGCLIIALPGNPVAIEQAMNVLKNNINYAVKIINKDVH